MGHDGKKPLPALDPYAHEKEDSTEEVERINKTESAHEGNPFARSHRSVSNKGRNTHSKHGYSTTLSGD